MVYIVERLIMQSGYYSMLLFSSNLYTKMEQKTEKTTVLLHNMQCICTKLLQLSTLVYTAERFVLLTRNFSELQNPWFIIESYQKLFMNTNGSPNLILFRSAIVGKISKTWV